MRPGMTPAMNSCPTEADNPRWPSGPNAPLPPVATAKMTIPLDGRLSTPDPPDLARTTAPHALAHPGSPLAPPVNPLPANSTGTITFGSLTKFCKVNALNLAASSEIPHRPPHSHPPPHAPTR